MALFRYRGKGNYHYEFQFKGKPYRGTLGTPKKTIARERFDAIKNQVRDAHYGVKRGGRDCVFEQAAKEFIESRAVSPSTISIDNCSLKHLLPMFGRMMLSQITDKDLKDYQNARLRKGAAAATINKEYELFRGTMKMFNWWEPLRGKVRKLAEGEFEGVALSPEDALVLLKECARSVSRSLVVIVTLALSTAMRFGELRSLRWWQIRLNRGYLLVGTSKTEHGKGRVIPLIPLAVRALTWWASQFPNRHSDDFVFPYERCARGKDGVVRYKNVPTKMMRSWKTAWQNAKKRCGIKCRFHDLRHTAITWMLEDGTPYPIVEGIAGWSPSTSVQMAKRYGHIGQEAFIRAVGAIEARFGVLTLPRLPEPAPEEPEGQVVYEFEPYVPSESYTDLNECLELIAETEGLCVRENCSEPCA